jgi:hypothetical protein
MNWDRLCCIRAWPGRADRLHFIDAGTVSRLSQSIRMNETHVKNLLVRNLPDGPTRRALFTGQNVANEIVQLFQFGKMLLAGFFYIFYCQFLELIKWHKFSGTYT